MAYSKYALTLSLKSQDDSKVEALLNYLDTSNISFRTKAKDVLITTSIASADEVIYDEDGNIISEPAIKQEIVVIVEKKGALEYLFKFANTIISAVGYKEIGNAVVNDKSCKVHISAEG